MFNPIKSKKVYEYIIEQIQSMILDGTLKKGDKLPSERVLAEQLEVSRASIREALRALEVIGLVESKQGGGNFIQANFEKSLFQPMSIMFMLQKSKPEDILVLRRILEIESATLAASRVTEPEILAMGQLIDDFKSTEDEESSSKIDKEFHYKVAQASGNLLLLNTLNVISNLIEHFIKDARAAIMRDKENKQLLIEQHEEIYRGVESRDPEKASQAMKKHFEFIEKIYMQGNP